jgi:hypothetical protein
LVNEGPGNLKKNLIEAPSKVQENLIYLDKNQEILQGTWSK